MSEDKIGGLPPSMKEENVETSGVKRIVTGGCVQDNPFEGPFQDDPKTWPLPPTEPLPSCWPAEPVTDKAIRKAIEEMQAKKEQRDETMGEGQDGGGLRMNAGKNRVELLPPEWIWALADVMSQGAKKYDARNWEKGMGWGSMIGCIQRHVLKFMAGERYDGDGFDTKKGTTGCHHLAMAAWNCLALMNYDLRKVGKNDLADEVTLDLLDAVNAATAKIEKGKKASW